MIIYPRRVYVRLCFRVYVRRFCQYWVFIVVVNLKESKSMSILEGSICNRMSTLMVSLEESIGLLVLKESIWNRVFVSMISLKESISMSVLEGSIQNRLFTMMSIFEESIWLSILEKFMSIAHLSLSLPWVMSESLHSHNTMLVQMGHWVRVKVSRYPALSVKYTISFNRQSQPSVYILVPQC